MKEEVRKNRKDASDIKGWENGRAEKFGRYNSNGDYDSFPVYSAIAGSADYFHLDKPGFPQYAFH